jgi:hypothetical protein
MIPYSPTQGKIRIEAIFAQPPSISTSGIPRARKRPLYCRFKCPFFWPVFKRKGKMPFFPGAWTLFPVEPESGIAGSAIRARIGLI